MDLNILPKEIIHRIAFYNGYKLRNGKLMKQLNVDGKLKYFFKSRFSNVERGPHYNKFKLGKTFEHTYSLSIFDSNGGTGFLVHKENDWFSVVISSNQH